jgi:hypothetical protein
MKKLLKYSVRAIAVLVGVYAAMIVLGEPSERSVWEILLMKAGAAIVVALMVWLYRRTIPKGKRMNIWF